MNRKWGIAMVIGITRPAHQREWNSLLKKEERLLRQRLAEGPGLLTSALEGKIPPKLDDTLTLTFSKAFSLVFSKGAPIIEKTYSKEALSQEFQDAWNAAQAEGSRASLRRVSRGADRSAARHVLLAGAEGSLLGFLGFGLPDIPLFSGLLLRNLHEIALSYGFSYDTPTERLFILRVIEVSLLRGEAYQRENALLTQWIDTRKAPIYTEKEQISKTAEALAQHLLYLKFIQGIPLIGIVGGFSDGLCLHRVSHYARMKYKRRFLKQGKVSLISTKLD